MAAPNRILALARLLRAQNIFTAAADALAGFGWTGTWDWGKAAPAAVASACLYCGGLVLNDLCDVERDQELHPERPIPSGAISPAFAFGLAGALTACGVLIASFIGPRVAAAAVEVALVAILYDAFLKKSRFAGALAMGVARGLNFSLGMAAGGALFADAKAWLAPGTVAVFIMFVTLLSTYEEGRSPRALIVSLVVLAAAALVSPLAWLRLPMRAALPLAAAAAVFVAVGIQAVRKDPGRFLPLVIRTGVRCLIPLDAAILLGWLDSPLPGLVVLAFLVPTWIIGSVLSGS